MTDDTTAASNADDELVAAYLADDLDPAATAAFEQRLAREPALVARLDALADALVALGGHDATTLPDGFDDRLTERLAAERAPNVSNLAQHRERRDRGRVWLGIGTAAAVLAAGAVMAGNMLGGMDSVSEEAALTAGDAESGGSEAAAGGDVADTDGSRPSAPVIVDRQVAVAGEDALRRRYDALAEAEGLLGTPLEEANALAERFTASVGGDMAAFSQDSAAAGGKTSVEAGGGGGAGAAGDDSSGSDFGADQPAEESGAEGSTSAQAPPQPSSAAPNAGQGRALTGAAIQRCLDVITEGATTTLVPVRVESVRYAGTGAISYVFVTASPDAQELDRVEVWVVRRNDCSTLVFQQS